MLTNIRPVDEREFARVLAEATATNTPLEVLGGGSKQHIGRPMQTAANISTKGLRGVTLYEPTEMVMSARAGTPLEQIEDALAARGQMLAFEPIELGHARRRRGRTRRTIAGVFATNMSGARRIRVGAARDHLLGVRGVNGRGEIFKSGGRVMKNVTGYDLCRGLAGSWGTLAVMSEVTFKVLPAPEDTATLILLGLPDEIAVEVLCAAMATPFEVSGAVHLQPPIVARLWHEGLRRQGQALTALRIENFAKSVAYRTAQLKDHLKAYGEIHELDRDNSLAFWGELRQLSVLQGSDAPLWRISTAPSAGPKVVAAITAYMECRAFYDWSGGLVWVEVLSTTDAGAADIRRVIATHGGHATLIRAEPQVRAAVEVFQPLEAGLREALAQAQGSLRPGRHPQSRPHVRQLLRDSPAAPHADQLHAKAAAEPAHRRGRQDPAPLRALRLLHRHLPDLRAARRRARQPARPHLPDEGDVRAGPQGEPAGAASRRPLPVLPVVHDHVPERRRLHASRRPRPRAHRGDGIARGFEERLARAMLAATVPYPERFRLALRLARFARPFTGLLRRLGPRRAGRHARAGARGAAAQRPFRGSRHGVDQGRAQASA